MKVQMTPLVADAEIHIDRAEPSASVPITTSEGT